MKKVKDLNERHTPRKFYNRRETDLVRGDEGLLGTDRLRMSKKCIEERK